MRATPSANKTIIQAFAVYLRVSTDMQVTDGHGLDTQERECLAYIRQRMGDTPHTIEVYREEGRSGAYTVRQLRQGREPVRPVLSDLVDAASDGKYTHIVTYEVSRVSREFHDWVMIHHLLLKPAGAKVLIVQGDLDLDDEDDAFVGNLLALVAHRERRQTRRRSMDGRENRRQAGYLPGGHAPYGWRWEPAEGVAPGGRRNIEPDPEEARWLQWMADKLVNEGWGMRRIGQELCRMGVESSPGRCSWTGPIVWHRLRHEVHAGLLKDRDGALHEAAFADQRLWSPEFRQRIIETLTARRPLRGRTSSAEEFPLLGLISCGSCGGRLYAHHSKAGQRFYRCERPQLGAPRECEGVMRRADHVEGQVAALLAGFVSSPTMAALISEEAASLIQSRQGERRAALTRIERDLTAMEARLEKLALAFTEGRLNAQQFETVMGNWQAQHDALVQEREDCQSRLASEASDRAVLTRVQAALNSFAQAWASADAPRIRELLQGIVEWLHLTPEGDEATVRLKLHLMPVLTAPVPRAALHTPGAEGVDRLTLRELALLAHLAEGRTEAEAAKAMGLPRVATSIYRIRRVMERRDLGEITALAEPRIAELRAILPMGATDGRRVSKEGPLTPRQREACELYSAGLSLKQMAAAMGTGASTPGALISDARKSLRRWLELHPEDGATLPPGIMGVLKMRNRPHRPRTPMSV